MDGNRLLNVSVILRTTLFLVGLHSIILGGTIYFFTTPFYQFFFSVDPDNVFFVKQSGVFLFLAGFFYLIPAINTNHYKLVIAIVIFSKVTAVAFLLENAHLTLSPRMIYLAAIGDGSMVIVLSILTLLWYKNNKKDSL